MISDCKFDGLLQIACTTMPANLATWLFVDCFDAERSELVFPGRGGAKVKYELDVDAINFVHNKYDIVHGAAPKIDEILERIKQNKVANEDFLRSWLMIAVSTFLCPPTSLGISPRCYPTLVDLERVKKLNWCNFVVDQLKEAAMNLDKKHSARGCLLLLVATFLVFMHQQFRIQNVSSFFTILCRRRGKLQLLSKRVRAAEPQGVEVDEEETYEDSDYADDEEEWISSSEDGGSDQGAYGGSDDEDGREEEVESDDFVPLSKRAKRMKSDPSKADKPPYTWERSWMKASLQGEKAQLSQQVLARVGLVIPPTEFYITKSIEEPTPPREGTSGPHPDQVPAKAPAMPAFLHVRQTTNFQYRDSSIFLLDLKTTFFCMAPPRSPDDASLWSLDNIPYEVLQEWEAQAIEINRQAKAKGKFGLQDTPRSAQAPTSKPSDTGPSGTASAQALRTHNRGAN
ncbi:hypothetical protein C2845_PM09G05240 [Panicum miliaceum]|uniref:Uncharacterized protein n=1 Tax=Panicum miliaceum TaxID=4540 RepID=A0A3L6RY80_PANMI|nr:hypothetical protein C2845_PM09G05240 [Panicum miliaceum]